MNQIKTKENQPTKKRIFAPVKVLIFVLAVISAVCLTLIFKPNFFLPGKNDLYIAVAGPMSGKDELKGREMIRGIKFCIDNVNKKGGIDGRKIKLIIFDDQNDSFIARKKAIEIIENPKILMVIGHYKSKASLKGGELYRISEIPAITASATDEGVTELNDWYFRVIFGNRSEGAFLADYVMTILKQDTISIIYDQGIYGSSLTRSFTKSYNALHGKIENTWTFNHESADIDKKIDLIAEDIKNHTDDPGMIFIAAHSIEAAKIVAAMRRKGIKSPLIGGESLGDNVFAMMFNNYPEEKAYPGYFSDNIYAASPVIFDIASEKAYRFREKMTKEYGQEPGWIAASYYEAALVAVKALETAQLSGDRQYVTDDRRKIRDALAGLNSAEKSVEGLTENVYFDKKGNIVKQVSMGFFQNQQFVSALTQLQPVNKFSRITKFDEEIEAGRIISVHDKYMHKTNIVYTGIKINEISKFNVTDLTFNLDFSLWFRYHGDFKADDIEFLNALEPIRLKKPSFQKTDDTLTYRRYDITARFKADFLDVHTKFGQHILGVSFYHRNLTRNNLIYVIDFLGMGLPSGTSFAEKLQNDHVFKSVQDWSIHQTLLFQDTAEKFIQGNPKYLDLENGVINFSRFNLGVIINQDKFFLANIISVNHSKHIFIISFILLILSYITTRIYDFERFLGLIYFFQVFLTFLGLMFSEYFFLNHFYGETSMYSMKIMIYIFDILWWIIPAVIIHAGIERFAWIPLEKKTGNIISNLVRLMTWFFIYFAALCGIFAFVFEQQLTGLLATSGMFAMIIGLAIKINISNIFSGIALNIERPFRVGDMVKFGNNTKGRVIDVNWRTTRIKTADDSICSIPNSTASETVIHNYYYPDQIFSLTANVYVDSAHPPVRVKKIITDAVLSARGVLNFPEPVIRFAGINEWSAMYSITPYYENYAQRFVFIESMWKQIWMQLEIAGIKFSIKKSNYKVTGKEGTGIGYTKNPVSLLNEVDIFNPFPDDLKNDIANRMKLRHFPTGSTIIHQGAIGDSLFIIVEGVLGVMVKFDTSDENKEVEVARRSAGDIVGEMALITGESRTATLVSITPASLFEITKSDIAPFMEKHPEMAEHLSRILIARQMETDAKKNVGDMLDIENDSSYSQLLYKIRSFFKLDNQ